MDEKQFEVTITKTTNKGKNNVSVCHFSASSQNEFDKELFEALKDENDDVLYRVRNMNFAGLGKVGNARVSDFREIHEGIYGSAKNKVRLTGTKEMTDSNWKKYNRTNVAEMRKYVPGEDLSNISVSKIDNPIIDMGMIARNPENHEDKWYVAKEYFSNNFEEVITQRRRIVETETNYNASPARRRIKADINEEIRKSISKAIKEEGRNKNKTEMKTIIKKFRKILKMNQKEFGHILGVSRSIVSRLERGKRQLKKAEYKNLYDFVVSQITDLCAPTITREELKIILIEDSKRISSRKDNKNGNGNDH
jgi:DNA-binding transcriptional regulator YiaG